jgi:ABC-type polar amino acid transport system ATPase subunit
MIALVGVTKRHEGRAVLDRVSMRFAEGRITAVVGPSGGGKSTLLRCIVGLEAFDAGEIQAFGHCLGPSPLDDQKARLAEVRRRVGLVFQAFHLFGHRTALGNVTEAPVHVKNMGVAEASARGRALLEKVGLAHRASAYPHELSGGEQQRVAIARALAMEPDALLLDEPTSALDPERTAGLFEILQGLREERKTLVIVTHEMTFAARIADHVVVLHGGEVVEEGAPAEVLRAPKDPRTRAFLAV